MKRKNFFGLNQPLAHSDHRRPVTRREFVSQGFSYGTGLALTAPIMSSLLHSPHANALSAELTEFLGDYGCGSFDEDNDKPAFICFDLAGGANFAGSNVLVGGPDGQEDFLEASGYIKQGLPVDRLPSSSTTNFIDESFGLLFHTQSQLLAGITEKASLAAPFTDGAVIAARSENDTGNNPHNPMYLINRYLTSLFSGDTLLDERGASGRLLSLIGSRSSDSGGNSLAPMAYIEPEYRPTKIDRPSDTTGLVDTGELVNLLGKADTEVIMESIYRLSAAKLGNDSSGNSIIQTGLSSEEDTRIRNLLRCGYLKGAVNSEQTPDDLNSDDRNGEQIIVGNDGTSIFDIEDFENEREFQKTASIMKLVIDGHAGAGTITMGGYDYHTGDRATGEVRDLRAGRCIGACLEYARIKNRKLMIYVFSDGSVFSNGQTDDTDLGDGKGVWTGDNQQTASPFFLAFDPNGRPSMSKHQLGYMRGSGDVETGSSAIANNVNSLTEAVALNYMAFSGERSKFENVFPSHTLGQGQTLESLVAFDPRGTDA